MLKGNNFPPEGFMKIAIKELEGISDRWSDCQFHELKGIEEKDVPPKGRNEVNDELEGIGVHWVDCQIHELKGIKDKDVNQK